MPRHRLYIDDPVGLQKGPVVIGGEEARHAVRVKRVQPGERVEVLDGAGRVGVGVFADSRRVPEGWTASIEVESVREEPPPHPRITVCTSVPEGGRLDAMIDGLSQAGAAEWRPLIAARSVADAPSDRKLERLRRIAIAASKQCGRAWMLSIGDPLDLVGALRPTKPGDSVVLAHTDAPTNHGVPGSALRLLIGPEGGWTPSELEAAHAAGASLARFGPHIMRIEAAAVVATAVLMNAHSA